MTKKMIPAFLLFLTPLFFIPITFNFFTTNKLALVFVMTLVLLGNSVYQYLTTKKCLHNSSLFTLSLGLFLAAIVINTLVIPEARVRA